MKWTNRDHEFDKLGIEISKNLIDRDKIYIYGAGIKGGELTKLIKRLNSLEGFIDENETKQKEGYLGLKVISPEEFFKLRKYNSILIVAASQYNTKIIMDKLKLEGFKEGVNCFTYENFISPQFLPLIYTYKFNKSFLWTISMLITEMCNLNCEKCAVLLPYAKVKKHYNVEEVKNNIDLFFSKIDFVNNWVFTGGEPLLHNNFSEIISYIGMKYSDSVGKISVISNGTLIPEDELIEVFKKYDVCLEISDYSCTLPQIEDRLDKLEGVLLDNKIKYIRMRNQKWVDFGFDTKPRSVATESEMINYFKKCSTPCRGYIDGKIYYCINAKMAEKALNIKEDTTNLIDLTKFDKSNNNIILAFDRGSIEKGYLEMCRICNGYITVNNNEVQAAKQIPYKNKVGRLNEV